MLKVTREFLASPGWVKAKEIFLTFLSVECNSRPRQTTYPDACDLLHSFVQSGKLDEFADIYTDEEGPLPVAGASDAKYKIDQACQAYKVGDINAIEFGSLLHEAGVPVSLIKVIGDLHDRALKSKPERCKECKGGGEVSDGWGMMDCGACNGTGVKP